MDLMEAIQQRRSIRAFTSKPVSKEVIREILSIACRAPSAMNTQPWEFVVLTGEKLNQIRAAIVEKLKSGAAIQPDHMVVGWPAEECLQRAPDISGQTTVQSHGYFPRR